MKQVILLCLLNSITLSIFSQISIIENENIGVGTETPTQPVHFYSNKNQNSFLFYQANGTSFEKDVVTIIDADNSGSRQDHSSVLKLYKSGNLPSSADGFSLLELTYTGVTNTAHDDLYWISAKDVDEKDVTWGVRLHSSDFITEGGLIVGATGNSNGTFTGGTSKLFNNGNLGLHTLDPQAELHVNGVVNRVASQTPSDKNIKSNISEFSKGLKEVLRLNPISFNYDKSKINSDRVHIGLTAQEVQKVVPEMIGRMSITSEKKGKEEFLNIYDNEIKYLLINAIKEQQEQIEKLKIQIEQLKIPSDIGEVSEQKQSIELEYGEKVFLGQNTPNPFKGITSINYIIPEKSISADILFYSDAGQLIKKERVETFGQGTLEINADDVASGVYSYTLEIDGRIVETKRMVINK